MAVAFIVFQLLIALGVVILICRARLARPKPRSKIFAAKQRGLFVFTDGVRSYAVDPIQVLMSMEEHPAYRFDRHPKLVREGDKEAMAVTVDAVRQAFGVGEFTEPGKPGLSFRECLQLLDAFFLYVDLQKKSTESKLTLAQSTAAT